MVKRSKQWIYVAVISSQLNNSHHLLFHNAKDKTLRFVFALLFSVILMVSDSRSHYLTFIRSGFSVVVAPLRYVVDYPVRCFNWVEALVTTQKNLMNENMQLHYQQTILAAELQKLKSIKEENSQLRQLLLTTAEKKESSKAMVARILAVETTNARQLMILDKGKKDKVYVGQPVLDAKGVMGQIIDVGYLTSTILLISDSKSAVPVSNNRTGAHGILVGTNDPNVLSLINLPHTALITKGDLLITSGLGRLYPEGYPVGRVDKVTHVSGDNFITVAVKPIAALDRDRLVLLIWPNKQHSILTQQIQERVDVMRKTV